MSDRGAASPSRFLEEPAPSGVEEVGTMQPAAPLSPSVHETDLHESLALLIEQFDDFRGQLQ